MPKIYTAFRGEIEENELVNETKKGYRVIGERGWDKIVFKKKQRAGWTYEYNKIWLQQRSFQKKKAAIDFARRQTLSMKTHYFDELDKIERLEQQLSC